MTATFFLSVVFKARERVIWKKIIVSHFIIISWRDEMSFVLWRCLGIKSQKDSAILSRHFDTLHYIVHWKVGRIVQKMIMRILIRIIYTLARTLGLGSDLIAVRIVI